MKKILLAISIFSCISVSAETSNSPVWQDIAHAARSINSLISNTPELKHRRLLLNETMFKSQLASSTYYNVGAKALPSKRPNSEISLPLPDGSFEDFVVSPTNVISEQMAESHPSYKTWSVLGIDNPDIKGVIDFTDNGFSAMLMMPDGDTVFIDPDKEFSGDVYKSFSKNQNLTSFHTALNCDIHDDHNHTAQIFGGPNFAIKKAARALDADNFPDLTVKELKKYRLALSGTAEYTDSQGGTAGARSSMVTSVNRINPIFERDLGIRLELVNAPELIFSDNENDPFSNPDDPNKLMIENGAYLSDQNMLDSFDIGHVLSHRSIPGGTGVAFIDAACRNDIQIGPDPENDVLKGLKAAGATTSSNPTGATFDLVLLAHELGHQLGAYHTFNSEQSLNCRNGRYGPTAVEPGSGSSIMAYGGLCGSDSITGTKRDNFFHFASISQIHNYTRTGNGQNCGTIVSQKPVPSADAGIDIRIPANTPFLLDGTSSGGTSSWDQIDIGTASAVDVDTGDNAIIRHKIPVIDADRYIPSLANLFAGTRTKGETLPTTTRELNFAYVVRNDGIKSDKKLINVTDTNSQFRVISQDSDQTIIANQQMQVTWNPADTNISPINCSTVDIQLIRENGIKNMLLASTPNDATETFIIPGSTPTMSGARVFVGCSDNSFFNISSGNIIVQNGVTSSDTTKPVITLLGVNPATVIEGSVYDDAGATATDNIDGIVSVTTSGTVNTDTVGVYTITYTASDSSGNTDTVTRTVNVMAEATPTEPTPTEPTPTEPTPTEPTPTEPTPTEPTPTNDLNGEAETNSGGGGGSFTYLLMPLMILLGLRRAKPVPVRTDKPDQRK